MLDLVGRVGWAAVVALPLLLLTTGYLMVAFATMLARTPTTRSHCRAVLRLLTEYATVLRSRP